MELDLTSISETKLYGDLSSRSSNCGRKIELTNTNNGKSVSVVVADACPTCLHEDDLDLSFAAFTSIATVEEGEVPSTLPLGQLMLRLLTSRCSHLAFRQLESLLCIALSPPLLVSSRFCVPVVFLGGQPSGPSAKRIVWRW